jgi:hypothetical protein
MKIKYPAVIVATLAHYILGGLWYSPLLFGNKFLQIINWPPEKVAAMGNESHTKELAVAFGLSLVLVYTLSYFVQYTKATKWHQGVHTAFWLWLGFIVTTQLPTVLFEQRPIGLFLINVGYQFVGCAIAGAILATWRPQETSAEAPQPA